MGRKSEWVRKYGIGGLSALAAVAILVVGVSAVAGSDEGARPTRSVLTLAADDDGTPDQGPGDVGVTTPSDQSTSSTTPTTAAPQVTAPPTTGVPSTVPPASGTRAIPVAGVGLVVITENPLGLVSSTPAPGFTSRVESSAREVHVRFEDANGGRIDVQAQIEGGAVRIRVRDDRTGRTTTTTPRTQVTTQTVPGTTIPGFDDHGGHGNDDSGFDDHGGDRNGDDHGGSSGHGSDDSGGDDHGGNSGHG